MRTEIGVCKGCSHKTAIINRKHWLCSQCNQDRISAHKQFLGIREEETEPQTEGSAKTTSAFVRTLKKGQIQGASFPELVKLLDILFSRWVKKVNTDERGMVKCYTCDEEFKVSEIQNGHFIPRTHMATRYHEDNCRPCCIHCNEYLDGNLAIFRDRLIKEIGTKRVIDLERMAKTEHKFTIPELQIMIQHYKFLLETNNL